MRLDRDGLGLETRRAFKNGIDVEWSRDVAGRPTARRTFKKSLAAAAMGFAVGMLATPSFAQPQREEVVVVKQPSQPRRGPLSVSR